MKTIRVADYDSTLDHARAVVEKLEGLLPAFIDKDATEEVSLDLELKSVDGTAESTVGAQLDEVATFCATFLTPCALALATEGKRKELDPQGVFGPNGD